MSKYKGEDYRSLTELLRQQWKKVEDHLDLMSELMYYKVIPDNVSLEHLIQKVEAVLSMMKDHVGSERDL